MSKVQFTANGFYVSSSSKVIAYSYFNRCVENTKVRMVDVPHLKHVIYRVQFDIRVAFVALFNE